MSAMLAKMYKIVKRRIYILNWIVNYNKFDAIADFIAGITLGLTMIPQSIAYAALAGLPSQYGLYSAFMGSMVYVIFGSVKEVSIGPTSLMALLSIQYTTNKPVEFMIFMAFIAGIVEFLMGILKLGFLVDFIPTPVTSAFTSATSLIIVSTQLKPWLGISFNSKGFLATILGLLRRLSDFRLGDFMVGGIGIVFLLLLRKIDTIPIMQDKKYAAKVKKFLWYISISRNALVVLVSSVIAYNWVGDVPFKLSGTVESGIPRIQIPQFTMHYDNKTMNFVDNLKEMGSGILLLPLVAVLANVAIAKSFSKGKLIDASQEMIALGLCNIFGSFFKAMPTCGAFTRSAVSHASGVRTPMAGIYSGTMTLLALSLLTPYFYFIPKATLAAVLMCAVAFMIDFTVIKKLWNVNKSDLVTWTICFAVCIIYGVEIGLISGAIISAVQLMFLWSRPTIKSEIVNIRDNLKYLKITPNLGMFYPGIDYLRERVNKALIELPKGVLTVVDCTYIIGLDYTTRNGLFQLGEDLQFCHEQNLVLINLKNDIKKLLDENKNITICDNEQQILSILLSNSEALNDCEKCLIETKNI